MERMAPASFHTPSLGDEPSYQAVKAPNNPLSPYAFFFKVTFLATTPSKRIHDPKIKFWFNLIVFRRRKLLSSNSSQMPILRA